MDRPRLLLTALAGVLLACLAAFAALAPGAQAGPNCAVDATIDSEEQRFLELINGYRQDNGLGPLALSPALTQAAAWKSQHMADANYFAHDDVPIARSWDQRIRDCGYDFNTWIGENIAAGNSDAAATFEQWRNSPGHNQNMLSGNYSAIGIGRAFNAGAAYQWYWTTDFGGFVDGAPPPTNTPPPTPTSTPGAPTATNTPGAPTATNTAAAPTATNTPSPTPTSTPAAPMATNTPVAPTATNTPTNALPPSAPTATTSPQPVAPAATDSPAPSPTPTSPLPPPGPPDPDGDVSCDGDASSLDAALVLQLDARVVASLPCLAAGDVNGDGNVDAIDALVILQYAAGLIPSLPI